MVQQKNNNNLFVLQFLVLLWGKKNREIGRPHQFLLCECENFLISAGLVLARKQMAKGIINLMTNLGWKGNRSDKPEISYLHFDISIQPDNYL